MIISTCPLRISLVGGSTDNPRFIEKYKTGSVINFASNLRTYSTLHADTFGYSSIDHKYVLNYSTREESETIDNIKNQLIRECFKYLNVDKINCSLTSDIFSSGSGLASSSSYLMSLIKSIYEFRNQKITDFEICKLAIKIEKIFNPLVGQQDFYGGGIGGLKKITFFENEDPTIRFLNTDIFQKMDMYLIYTGIYRQSTNILETINTDNSLILIKDVNDLESAINELDVDKFSNIMKRSWENKKLTSPEICSNELSTLDKKLTIDRNILSHKLCGAGGGGYFLIFTNKNIENLLYNSYKNIKQVNISETGISFNKI